MTKKAKAAEMPPVDLAGAQTWQENKHDNTLQFLMQLIVNDK